MPPLCLHLTLARDAFPHLQQLLGDTRGYYLLGATLPDIHLIAGYARHHTHYVDLGVAEEGQEIDRFFRANPHLLHTGNHRPTRSLVAGYLSHLVVDSVWITRIYQPHFGPQSSLATDPFANLLDRLLQYELDRREREDLAGMAALVRDIGLVSWDEEAALFDEESLMQWQTFVMDSAVRPPTWDRFPMFLHHYVARRSGLSETQLKQFLADFPQKLTWVLDHVGPEALAAFREESLQESLRVTRERLR